MKPTLQSLLRWAKKNELYIEIFGDGQCEIEYPRQDSDSLLGFEYEFLAEGKTLYQALLKARKEWK